MIEDADLGARLLAQRLAALQQRLALAPQRVVQDAQLRRFVRGCVTAWSNSESSSVQEQTLGQAPPSFNKTEQTPEVNRKLNEVGRL